MLGSEDTGRPGRTRGDRAYSIAPLLSSLTSFANLQFFHAIVGAQWNKPGRPVSCPVGPCTPRSAHVRPVCSQTESHYMFAVSSALVACPVVHWRLCRHSLTVLPMVLSKDASR